MKKLIFYLTVAVSSIFNCAKAQPGNTSSSMLGFNGSNQYVQVPANAAFDFTTGTVELWVRPEWVAGAPGYAPCMFSLANPSKVRFSLHMDNNYTNVSLWNGAAGYAFSYAFAQSKLYHIVFVITTSTTYCYVNGTQLTPAPASGGLTSANSLLPLNIGNYAGNQQHFNGKIDEVRVWNVARTLAQVRDAMHLTLTGSETGLVSYYQFNEGSGSTTNDNKGTNNGTLFNSPSWLASAFPIGGGTSNLQTEAAGNIIFAGTNFSANYSTSGGAAVGVSKINSPAQPNAVPSGPATSSVLNGQYWILNRFGGSAYNAAYTFKTSEDLTATDAGNPGGIQLYGRTSTSDGAWSLVSAASSVDDVNDLATFSSINGAFGQYIIVKGKVITATTPSAPVCSGIARSISYDGTGITFNAGNNFTVQLSDANGSFVSPVTIGTLSSTASSGTINATMPAATGTKFRLRVVSDNPILTGLDNGADFTLVDPINNSVVNGLANTGLAGFYKLDGNANDASTNAYQGTITGGVNATTDHLGISNGAMSFNGTNSGIDVGNAANLRMYGAVSISAWINIPSYPSSKSVIVTKYFNTESYQFYIDNIGRINLLEGSTTLTQNVGVVPLNQWVHIVGTTTSGNWKLYMNGKQVNSSGAGQSFLDSGGNFQIGKDGTANRFTGSMDELRVYNRVLSLTEVQVLFNDGVAFNDGPVCQGGTITLTALAATGSPSYSWSGPNSFSSSAQNPPAFTNAAANLTGTYILTVTNNGCASVPQRTVVMVNAQPATPGVTDGARCSNGTVTLTASGSTNGNYRWYTVSSGGSPIGGQTNSTYTTPSLSSTTPYWVSMLNTAGCEGPRAQVNGIINTPIDVTLATGGTSPICSGSSTSISVTASEASASYQVFKGATAVSAVVAGGGTLNIPVPSSNLTVGANTLKVTVTKAGCGSADLTNTVSVTVNDPPVITTQPSAQNKCTGNNVSFSIAATGAGLSYQWRLGTTNLNDGGSISGATTSTLTITGLVLADVGNYNCVVSGTCSPVATSNNAALSVVSVTNISAQPANDTKCTGQSSTFSVTASAPGSTLTYQWRKGTTNLGNGGNISGVTTASLTLNNLSPGDAGNYNCVISGGCSPVTSSDGTLSINTPPSITGQPANDTRCAGSNSGFSVTASGTALTYQWRKGTTNLVDGGNISGATTVNLILSNVAPGDAGNYNCVVSGACSPPATSGNATLTVSSGASITAQPSDDVKCPGSTSGFVVTATGAGLTYQWRKGTTNLTNGGNISGAASSTLTLGNITASDGGSYNCVIGAACGASVTTNNALLTVNIVPAITAQPVNDSKCVSTSSTFSITATGTGLSYQWRKGTTNLVDNTNVSGSGTSSLTLSNLVVGDAGNYNCVVSGTCASAATSNNGILAVLIPPVITSQPVALSKIVGQAAIFSAVASNVTSYQWRKVNVNLSNGGGISGATSSTLTLSNLIVADAGAYNCIVTNSCGNDNSVSALLTVAKATPTITFTSPVASGTEGDQLLITATSTSPAPITFSITGGTGQGSFPSADHLKLDKAGTIEVTASQSSTADYNSAIAIQIITAAPDLITGVGDGIMKIKFFPNPARGEIQVIGIPNQSDKILLIDSKGIIAKQWTVDEYSRSLNIEGIAAGMYILKTMKQNNEVGSERIVIY